MNLGTLAGALLGLGLYLALRAVFPPRPPLALLLDQYDTAHTARPSTTARRPGSAPPAHRLTAAAAARGWPSAAVRTDLDLLGRTDEQYLARLAAAAVAGAAGGLLAAMPAARVSHLLAGWLVVLGAGGMVAAAHAAVRRNATARRRDLRAALGAYLNLVSLRMASGAGLAEALRDAARIGDGPLFRRLRSSFTDARTRGHSHAEVLHTLGTSIGLADLRDLAATVGLVESGGAQAAATLRVKAASLRDRQLADLHGNANERTQTMTVAQALLAFGYLLFLGYPALSVVGNR